MSSTIEERKIKAWNDQVTLTFQVRGAGPDLIYFHPAAGPGWDPFLEELARDYTIYAPQFPGTSPDAPHDIHKVDNLADAVMIYEEAFRALGLQRPIAIGQSFGGMMALELAAAYPDLFSRVIVMDPIGLWRDDLPVTNWITAAPAELPGLLFRDPSSPEAQAMLAMPEDKEAAVLATAQLIWNLGATGKMVWPIPDRGLAKRLHRIRVPTLIVWGDEDALVSSAYANEFRDRIKGSRAEIIKNCGHIPQVERPAETLAVVRPFLAA